MSSSWRPPRRGSSLQGLIGNSGTRRWLCVSTVCLGAVLGAARGCARESGRGEPGSAGGTASGTLAVACSASAPLATWFGVDPCTLPRESGFESLGPARLVRRPGEIFLANAHPATMTIDDRGNVLFRCDIGSRPEGFWCLQVGHIEGRVLERMKGLRDEATKGDFVSPRECSHCKDCGWSAIDLYRPTIVGLWSTMLAGGGERCKRRDSMAAATLVSWFVAVELQARGVGGGVQLWTEAVPCSQQPRPPLMFGYKPCELPFEAQVSRLTCPPSAGRPGQALFEMRRSDGRSSQTLMIDRDGYVWRDEKSSSKSEQGRPGWALVGRARMPGAYVVGLANEVTAAKLVPVDGACGDCGSSSISMYPAEVKNGQPTVLARDGRTREVRDSTLMRACLRWLLAVFRDASREDVGDARYIGDP